MLQLSLYSANYNILNTLSGDWRATQLSIYGYQLQGELINSWDSIDSQADTVRIQILASEAVCDYSVEFLYVPGQEILKYFFSQDHYLQIL